MENDSIHFHITHLLCHFFFSVLDLKALFLLVMRVYDTLCVERFKVVKMEIFLGKRVELFRFQHCKKKLKNQTTRKIYLLGKNFSFRQNSFCASIKQIRNDIEKLFSYFSIFEKLSTNFTIVWMVKQWMERFDTE